MFLIGGPPYCGTTLLTLMLNQVGVACLNEPDFHDPGQNHNGLPVLQSLYPEKHFPRRGTETLSHEEVFALMQHCAYVIAPDHLGFKYCSQPFVEYSNLFRAAGLPVVAIIRDIRDSLVRPLKPYIGGEVGLVQQYRQVWKNRSSYDLIIRYEELVADPAIITESVSSALGIALVDRSSWDPDDVTPSMLYPQDRHGALKIGSIVTNRVGLWRECGKTFSQASQALAQDMGYPAS